MTSPFTTSLLMADEDERRKFRRGLLDAAAAGNFGTPEQPPSFLDRLIGGARGVVNRVNTAVGDAGRAGQLGAIAPATQAGIQRAEGIRVADERTAIDDRLAGVRERLAAAQIRNLDARSEQGGSPGSTNVQSTFKGSNGNMFIVKRNGEVVDTGVAFNERINFFELEDGSVVGVDSSTGERIGTPITPAEAAEASTREQHRKDQVASAIELPSELAALDSTIGELDRVVGKIDAIKPLVKESTVGIEVLRSNLPGFLGGEARQLGQAIKSLQANLGFDTLQKMRAASKTGGALGQVSERELDLLINAMEALDQGGDPKVLSENLEKVQTHYNNYVREINKMKKIMRERAGQDTSEEEIDFSQMSDDELRRLASGR